MSIEVERASGDIAVSDEDKEVNEEFDDDDIDEGWDEDIDDENV